MPGLDDTQQLVGLIDQKHEVLRQLHTLSQYQLRLAGNDGYVDELMRVLSAKQTLIAKLTSVDQLLEPFREQDPESRVWISRDVRSRCSQVAAKCSTLLDELKMLEQKSTAAVITHRDELAQQLRQNQFTVDSTNAYQDADRRTSGGFDLTEGNGLDTSTHNIGDKGSGVERKTQEQRHKAQAQAGAAFDVTGVFSQQRVVY